MTDEKVRNLLQTAPFNLGGGLNLETGRETFVPLEMHKQFRNRVIQNRARGVSIWPLAGPVGIGRTWTLAWTGRQAIDKDMEKADERWEAALVPGLGEGKVRDLYESIFASTEYLREEAKKELPENQDNVSGQGREGILNHALLDDSSWAVLTGDKGRFPTIEGVDQKPKWTRRQTQVEFLVEWLRRLHEVGVDNFIILIDEFETTVTRLSSNKMTDFSDGLRRLYDVVEENQEDMPNLEVILSATTQAATKIDPSASSEDLPGWLTALQSRMDRGFVLTKIDEEEAMEIAAKCIDYRRTEDAETAIHPYTEEAISTAYRASDGLPRRLSEILNEMYIISYDDTLITEEDAEEAIEILGYDLRPA